jgi:ketosteroid isomerase-like protein
MRKRMRCELILKPRNPHKRGLSRWVLISFVTLLVFVLASGVFQALSASTQDEKSEAQIRRALAAWVKATNRRDEAAADAIWGPNVVGWFPEAPEFSGSAAFALAGKPERKGESYSTYEVKIDEVDVSGTMAVVHDIWTETKHFNGSTMTVRRVIRGSELWRLQPDGKWKIVRFVSAPEKWEKTE